MLPAYAGMIRQMADAHVQGDGAPRVCGDDPQTLYEIYCYRECSPRMRG